MRTERHGCHPEPKVPILVRARADPYPYFLLLKDIGVGERVVETNENMPRSTGDSHTQEVLSDFRTMIPTTRVVVLVWMIINSFLWKASYSFQTLRTNCHIFGYKTHGPIDRRSSTLSRVFFSSVTATTNTQTTTTTRTTNASSSSSSIIMKLQPGDAQFGKFRISKESIFYRSNSTSTIAFVNLRPIVPGHVLVMSERNVPRLSDLQEEEYVDLWKTVRTVQRILEIQYQQEQPPKTTTTTSNGGSSCSGRLSFNVAVQDGVAAGQSVPHVHVHILPRKTGDYAVNDHVYEDLEQWEPRSHYTTTIHPEKNVTKLNVPNDQDRRDRTAQEMAEEAAIYRSIVESMQDI